MGVKLWSLAIANMFVLVLTLLATVAASPLPSQDPRDPEISQTEDLAVEASNLQEIQSRVPAAVRLAILSAANAQPATVDRSPGYGKRSADDESEGAEDVTETEDLAVEASSLQSSERVPAAVRWAILNAANAQPATVVRSPGYGKRSADSKDESETKLGLVADVPLDAVKVKIHSSHGNIAQQYDGDTEYQNAYWAAGSDEARERQTISSPSVSTTPGESTLSSSNRTTSLPCLPGCSLSLRRRRRDISPRARREEGAMLDLTDHIENPQS